KAAEKALERAGITANKNAVPFDPEKPAITSGIRLGSPAATARGFREAEFRLVGEMIDEVLTALAASGGEGDAAVENNVHERVRELCKKFPIYK
ncbi:serine hydroxymethyltransferase, partial [Acetobacter estunensis]|nr:serine hydroxymethyltransferase [Acetobacter estunensis]